MYKQMLFILLVSIINHNVLHCMDDFDDYASALHYHLKANQKPKVNIINNNIDQKNISHNAQKPAKEKETEVVAMPLVEMIEQDSTDPEKTMSKMLETLDAQQKAEEELIAHQNSSRWPGKATLIIGGTVVVVAVGGIYKWFNR